jgi:hypothetical protein
VSLAKDSVASTRKESIERLLDVSKNITKEVIDKYQGVFREDQYESTPAIYESFHVIRLFGSIEAAIKCFLDQRE